jgi:hypothetical protein
MPGSVASGTLCIKGIVCQVGYLLELREYRDAPSPEYEFILFVSIVIHFLHTILRSCR